MFKRLNHLKLKYLVFILLLSGIVTITNAQKSSIVSGYRHEFFPREFDDRAYAYFQYGRKINDHEVFVRINSLHRSGESGFQYEIDLYPRFTKKSYAYFNLSTSGYKFFPKYRTAAEFFQSFANRWELSVGVRTIHIEDYDIFSPTGTIGIYYGNWYSYLRPTVNILQEGISASLMFVTRRYFGDGKDYLELLLLKGEDRGAQREFNAIENTFGFDTYVVRLKGVLNLNSKYTLSAGADYSGLGVFERESYLHITSFDLTLKRYF